MNDSDIKISILDLRGSLIDVLKKGKVESGYYQIDWAPKNISSGIYFIRIESNDMVGNKKITFLK